MHCQLGTSFVSTKDTLGNSQLQVSHLLYESGGEGPLWCQDGSRDTDAWPVGAPQAWGAPYGAPQQPEEERPPPGCERDALKLFLSGLPKTWDLPDVKAALEEFGTVSLAASMLA